MTSQPEINTTSSKKITIKIDDGKGGASAASMGLALIYYQNMIYEIGEHISEGKSRNSGALPQAIKNEFKLEITGLRKGSAVADVQIFNNQLPLPTYPSKSDRALDMSCDILQKINNGQDSPEDYETLINDPLRLLKIFNNVYEFWPNENSDDISFSEEEREVIQLDRAQRKNIESIKSELKQIEEIGQRSYFGRFIRYSADQNKIVVETSEGKRTFTYDRKDKIELSKNLLKLMHINSDGKILKSFKISDNFEITEFIYPDAFLKILKPVHFSVTIDEEDDMFIIKNTDFEIFSFNSDFKKAREDIEMQLHMLWEDFVLEEETKLSKSGLLMKKLLRLYLGENYAAKL